MSWPPAPSEWQDIGASPGPSPASPLRYNPEYGNFYEGPFTVHYPVYGPRLDGGEGQDYDGQMPHQAINIPPDDGYDPFARYPHLRFNHTKPFFPIHHTSPVPWESEEPPFAVYPMASNMNGRLDRPRRRSSLFPPRRHWYPTPTNSPYFRNDSDAVTQDEAASQHDNEPTSNEGLTHDDVKDFLKMVAQDDMFVDDDFLLRLKDDDGKLSSTVFSSHPTDDAVSLVSGSGRFDGQPLQQETDLLQQFRAYWRDQEMLHGPQEEVLLQLDGASAIVQTLQPRTNHRLDNMWTPLTRRCRRICGKKARIDHTIFTSVSATFYPGRMTLLIGEPGSGKSTLLKMLAGRLQKDYHWRTSGTLLNGQPIEQAEFHPARYIALVDETDLHIPTMTVQDTLLFAYQCNSAHADKKHVDTILQILGLSHVAKTIVGNEDVRGCSGGERRRVTIGEQWAANVRALLADRLTDGLDSQATLDLIKALRVWCTTTRATVVLALLQPPPEVYKYFDDVCILHRNEGANVLYSGSIRNAASYMAQMGYEAERPGPAPYLAETAAVRNKNKPHNPFDRQASPYKRNYFAHLYLLIGRQFKLEFLNKGLVISRLVLSLANGLLTASVFKQTSNTQRAFFVRTSMLFHTCMTVVISVVSHIGLLGADRPVFYKQRASFFFHSSGYWIAHNFFHIFFWALLESFLLSVTSYWISGLQKVGYKFVIFWMATYMLNIASTLIFKALAIVCRTVGIAQTWAGVVQVVFFIFSGFLQPWISMPSGWLWARWISPQSYSFSIMMLNEFVNTTYPCTNTTASCPFETGDQWLQVFYGIDPTTGDIWWLFVAMLAWIILYFLIGMVAIHYVKWERKIMHRMKPYQPEASVVADTKRIVRPEPVTLSWKDISYSVKQKKEQPKVLLQNVSGMAIPSTMSALMGPSGAGKTTLLDVLAGRKTGGEITGDICVNGHPKEQQSFIRISGYVEQFNCHIEILTVGEMLEFSAKLRLQSGISVEKRKAFVESVIEMLELGAIVHEQVADILADQKKRLSVGVEVVTAPSILFLDEPTTGLDSMGAFVLVSALKKLRDEMNVAIVCTIHQPSKDLFNMFDRLVLMAKGGKMVYASELGPQSAKFIRYLEGAPGVAHIKEGENPAVWMLQQMGGGVSPDPQKMENIVAYWPRSEPGMALEKELSVLVPGKSMETGQRYNLGYGKQLGTLLDRAMRIYWRTSSYNLVRTTMVVVLSVLLGTVYWLLEYTEQDVWPRLALLYTLTFYIGLTFLLSGITLLMPLRPSYYKERASGAYSSWLYGLSYFIAELPYVLINSLLSLVVVFILSKLYNDADDFWQRVATYWLVWVPFFLFLYMCTILGHSLSAISPTLEVANAIGPGMASWFSSFAGFYLPYPDIPTGYTWLYWLNPLRYAYEAQVLSEFPSGYNITCSTGAIACVFPTTDSVIQYMGMLEWGYGMDIGVVAAYLAAFIVLTLIGLKWLRFGTK